MLNAEMPSVGAPYPLCVEASSVQAINWTEIADTIGHPVNVLLDYDQAIALATQPVSQDVKTSICRARELGSIAKFGIASDNPLASTLSGMRSHIDYNFGPYINGARLVTKASTLFYSRILDVLNIDPSCVVMVGHDIRRDIINAQEVGIATIRVPALGTLYQGLVANRGRQISGMARRIIATL
ncbi:HAD hydrolase-like protein [Candidatus Saccharibacteria bacterium]|nr:HAD hydrolase-like protein [Candidatus Saccharibacteria bacterium]